MIAASRAFRLESVHPVESALDELEYVSEAQIHDVQQQLELIENRWAVFPLVRLRPEQVIGAMLQAKGFPCTPSPERPVPNLPYFQGGYTVRRHVAPEAPVAGLQIECNLEGVRDTAANRERFATALVAVLREYLAEHFELKLPQK